jgi:hypothetical protein
LKVLKDMKNYETKRGFSVIEFLFAIVLASIVGFVVILFAKDIITLNASSQASITAVLEGRKVISVMVKELRSAMPSALGSYPIESTATSSVVFFTDVNGDDVSDRIRFFLDPATRSMMRGVILASGSPPAYTSAETFSTLVSDVANSTSTPIFEYYDGNYNGGTPPLTHPINITDVRLIKLVVVVDEDVNRTPPPITMTSQAMLRNLKDNI